MLSRAESPGTWVQLALVERAGYPHMSLIRHAQTGVVVARRSGRRTEVQLESLAPEMRVRVEELLAQAAKRDERPQLTNEVRSRLHWLAPAAQQALLNEAARRAVLLERFASIEPKRVGSVLAEDVVAILSAWPATDPEVLRARPKWGEPIQIRWLYRSLEEYRANGAEALLPKAPVVTPEDGRRFPMSPQVQELLLTLRLAANEETPFLGIWRTLVKRLEGTGEPIPSVDTCKRFLARHLTTGQRVYHQQGPKALRARVLQPLRRSEEDVDVGEGWSGDNHQLDFLVIDQSTQELKRPWLTMFLDIRSRAPIGWCFSLESPNSARIAEAFIHGVQPKPAPFDGLCGRPEWVYVDNGKDFCARILNGHLEKNGVAVAGLFGLVGTKVIHALPFNARAKVVERWFNTLCNGFSKLQTAYWGNSPATRPERTRAFVAEYQARIKDGRPVDDLPFLTFSELQVRFAEWAAEYLVRPSESDGLRDPRSGQRLSPAQMVARRKQAPIVAKVESMVYAAYSTFDQVVRKGEVKISGEPFHAAELPTWNDRPVRVRWSRTQPDLAFVFDEKARLICVAKNAVRVAHRAKGLDPERVLQEELKRKRAEEKAAKLLQGRRLRGHLGKSLSDVVVASMRPTPPAPATAASTASTLPTSAVPQIHPIDRVAREMASAAATAHAGPAAPPPAGESDEEYCARLIGQARPTLPAFYDEMTARRVARDQAEWDETAAGYLAARNSKQGENA